MTFRPILAALGALALIGLTAGPAAAADEPTAIAFSTASPVEAAYGGNWSVQLKTRLGTEGSRPVPPSQATVQVTASGIADPIATGLPIQPDGSVFLSAPLTSLPPGDYQLTAILQPAPGSSVATSQTSKTITLHIASYALTASASVDQAGVDAGDAPVVELALSGEFVDSTGAVPPGSWHLKVTDQDGGGTVLETDVDQPAGATDPVRYPITADLDRGHAFSVEASFVPASSLADGLTLTQPGAQTFRTRGDSLGDALGREIPYPLWLLILTLLVPLALAAAAIVLTVRLSRGGAVPAAAAATGPTPAPTPVEPEQYGGITDLFPLQQAAPEYPPTQVTPQSAPQPQPPSWETPTERIEPPQQPQTPPPPTPQHGEGPPKPEWPASYFER